MRKLLIVVLILSLVLVGCTTLDSDCDTTNTPDLHESTPVKDQSSQTDPTVSLEDEPSVPVTSDSTEATLTVPDSTGKSTEGTEPAGFTESTTQTQPPQQAIETPTTPTNLPEETKPTPTTPPETTPTQPQETEQEETLSVTEPEETAPQIDKNSYEFKRQVAQYAAQYINQYRAEAGVNPCEVLPGMTLVAEYRADQLTRNYAHDTADKREVLAHYQYGKWVDATLVGLDASKSYYDAEAPEAICAGFNGSDAEAMGKKIADLIRNSPSHWSYIGSSKFSYIGIGVEYRAGSAYR
ncbi:MAG: hypothetical protein IJ403_00900 [Oscillospiraceae bacterium]|nr:hypothetical protein [Oscillospiraceae bacterium]